MLSFSAEIVRIFSLSFLVGLSGAASPGPLVVLNIRESIRHGFIAGPYIATGHSLIELVMVILLSIGLEKLLTIKGIPSVIALFGGSFLIYMAWGIIKTPTQDVVPFGREQTEVPNHQLMKQPILSGVLVTLGNPFWFVWWLTIGVTLLTRSSVIGGMGSIAFYLGHILADYSWLSLISFVISTGRKFLTKKVYSSITIACALFLGITGLYFIVSGSEQLITVIRV